MSDELPHRERAAAALKEWYVHPITLDVIRQILTEHWKRRDFTEQDCFTIMTAARVVSDRRPPAPPPVPAAIEDAKRFLRNLPDARTALENEAWLYSRIEIKPDGSERTVVHDHNLDSLARCQATSEALTEAGAAAGRLIAAWEARDPVFIEDRNPADFLADCLRHLWLTRGEDAPRSLQADDPLPMCIAALLNLAGIRPAQGKNKGGAYTGAAVAAVLDGRTKRQNFMRSL